MRSQSSTATAVNSADPFTPTITDRDEALARIHAAAGAVRAELALCSAAGNGAGRPSLHLALRGLAREIVRVPRPNRRDAWVHDVLGFITSTNDVGGHDLPASREAQVFAREDLAKGWPGLLAAMLQVPSWQLPDAPAFDAVPDWLWGDYAAWLFCSPLRFANADRDIVPEFHVQRVRELERWVGRNSGSSSVRAAVAAYLAATKSAFFPAPRINAWRQEAESRGRILTRAHLSGRAEYDPPIEARHGRRLRVGFIAQSFDPSPGLYATLPCFEQIDARAFDVFLFSLVASDTAEAAYGSRRVRGTHVLPGDVAGQIDALRKSQLDVVVFMGDPSREWNAVTELALHRVAPLQVVNHRSGRTTGLPEIDLYVSGERPASASPNHEYTERLGVLRGPAHSIAFARPETAAGQSSPGPTRADLGLRSDRTLLVTMVGRSGAPLPLLQEWAKVLSRSEEAHLAVSFVHDGTGSELTRFCFAVDRALADHGVASDRVSLFPSSETRPLETRVLIALADLYLDADADELAAWGTAEALSAGAPVIALSQREGNAPQAMLGSIGLTELIAADWAAYGALATELIANAERRAALRKTIEAVMETTPEFMDSLAASDAFGALIESAFDELSSLGRQEFRGQSEPVRCFRVDDPAESVEVGLEAHARGEIETAAMEASLALRTSPLHTKARYLQGLVLHAQGNTSRAVDYLLAAVQCPEATASMWYSLALALRDNRQMGEAIQVLETCLRMDHGNVDVLLTLLEMTEAVGATEIGRDVLECLQQVAPTDPRVLALG